MRYIEQLLNLIEPLKQLEIWSKKKINPFNFNLDELFENPSDFKFKKF